MLLLFLAVQRYPLDILAHRAPGRIPIWPGTATRETGQLWGTRDPAVPGRVRQTNQAIESVAIRGQVVQWKPMQKPPVPSQQMGFVSWKKYTGLTHPGGID